MAVPRISIIIPTYNMALTLANAIESVLSQTMVDFELLIVDDGSSDDTRTVVTKFLEQTKNKKTPITYIFQKNQGKSVAANNAIQKAKGNYITFLDADDILTKDSLEVRADALDRNPKAGMVYADAFYTDLEGNIYNCRKSKSFSSSRALLSNLFAHPATPIIGPTIMVRKNVFEQVGGYDSFYWRAHDIEMHARILSRYDVLYLPKPVLYYRTYLRRSRILKLRFDTIRSWYLIFDTYVKRKSNRIVLKATRTIFELGKLLYEFISYKK